MFVCARGRCVMPSATPRAGAATRVRGAEADGPSAAAGRCSQLGWPHRSRPGAHCGTERVRWRSISSVLEFAKALPIFRSRTSAVSRTLREYYRGSPSCGSDSRPTARGGRSRRWRAKSPAGYLVAAGRGCWWRRIETGLERSERPAGLRRLSNEERRPMSADDFFGRRNGSATPERRSTPTLVSLRVAIKRPRAARRRRARLLPSRRSRPARRFKRRWDAPKAVRPPSGTRSRHRLRIAAHRRANEDRDLVHRDSAVRYLLQACAHRSRRDHAFPRQGARQGEALYF